MKNFILKLSVVGEILPEKLRGYFLAAPCRHYIPHFKSLQKYGQTYGRIIETNAYTVEYSHGKFLDKTAIKQSTC